MERKAEPKVKQNKPKKNIDEKETGKGGGSITV